MQMITEKDLENAYEEGIAQGKEDAKKQFEQKLNLSLAKAHSEGIELGEKYKEEHIKDFIQHLIDNGEDPKQFKWMKKYFTKKGGVDVEQTIPPVYMEPKWITEPDREYHREY